MSIIYSPEETTVILRAMAAVNNANNGYAFMHLAPAVASALVLAGYRIASAFHPIDGQPCYRVFTTQGWHAYKREMATA